MMTWMLCSAVFTACLSVAARLVESALAITGPRRHIWMAAVLLSLGVPALALLTDGRVPGALLSRAPVDLPDMLIPWSGDAGAAVFATPLTTTGLSQDTILAGSWLVLSVLLLAGYAAIWLRFVGSATEWRPDRVCGRSVRIAARVGPAVFGLLRPVIVVPEWVLRADPAVQRLILLHEDEHIRAGDHVLLAFAPLALIAMPWNLPLLWQIRQLRLAAELDCDRRVLNRGMPPREYGSLLLEIASRSDRLPAALAALAGPRTSLERRIIAMSTLTASRRRTRAAILVASSLILVTAFETFAIMTPATAPVAGALVPFAADTPIVAIDGVIVADRDIERTIGRATIRSVEMIRGADAVQRFGEEAAGGVLLVTTSRAAATSPIIIVDGIMVPSTSVADLGLDPQSIESVDVIKGAAAQRLYGEAGAQGVILITTKK